MDKKKSRAQRADELLNKLREFNRKLEERAKGQLTSELREAREQAGRHPEALVPELFDTARESRFESLAPELAERGSDFALETIVLRTGRPVLAVVHNEAQLEFREAAESEFWKSRLSAAGAHLGRAIRATGRIELENNPRFDWVGTGWLVKPTIVVTNRHVASEFAVRRGESFVFRAGTGGQMRGSIDFLEEVGRQNSLTFRLKKVLHIEPDNGPDMAFLEVETEGGSGRLAAEPVPLAPSAPGVDRFVATIGYPARDSRIPELDLMERIFGNVFDKKRLAPGQVMLSTSQQLQHDCSTLGGNSGSVVLDLSTGEAVALHFAGRFLQANFAVPAGLVAAGLSRLRTGVTAVGGKTAQPVPRRTQIRPRVSEDALQTRGDNTSLTCTVPVTFTIQVGAPVSGGRAHIGIEPGAGAAGQQPRGAEEDELFVETEAPPESYANREGFRRDFLGDRNVVELPEPQDSAGQILTFELDGATQQELKYQNFSVVMNRQRRMCLFSACNIDGKQSKRTVRAGWRFDSRIPQKFQIMKECYGNPPKFSRGHMTRREDPAWGSRKMANLGNEDSMHVTNAVPQMQSFNGGIWLTLEDFALQNAREDDMRISVITGPFLREDDPVYFGVQVPVAFWKVIAFIHDRTRELTATGYSISQEDHLGEQEFVFGEFGTFQRSLGWIEENAGVSFGTLSEHDPLAGEEVQESLVRPLAGLEQIRFTR
jgi:endonuclease G